jgi:hypothetical protein
MDKEKSFFLFPKICLFILDFELDKIKNAIDLLQELTELQYY